jgi:hypothetical protein
MMAEHIGSKRSRNLDTVNSQLRHRSGHGCMPRVNAISLGWTVRRQQSVPSTRPALGAIFSLLDELQYTVIDRLA